MNAFIDKLKAAKAEKIGKVIYKSQPKNDDLSLTELREKYPNISARSKVDFLKKLSDGN